MPPEQRPDVLLTSPFVRAQQTTACVADALGIARSDIRVDERLREKEFGILDRYTKAGIIARFPELAEQRALVGKFYFRPPGGETPRETGARAVAVLAQATSDAVIVTHKGVMRALLALATGWDMVGKPPIRFPAEGHALLMEWREGVLYLQPDTVDMRN